MEKKVLILWFLFLVLSSLLLYLCLTSSYVYYEEGTMTILEYSSYLHIFIIISLVTSMISLITFSFYSLIKGPDGKKTIAVWILCLPILGIGSAIFSYFQESMTFSSRLKYGLGVRFINANSDLYPNELEALDIISIGNSLKFDIGFYYVLLFLLLSGVWQICVIKFLWPYIQKISR
ncbi:hypothetical protein KQ51_01354 [Candidatus Izimaplasma bacterium HR1]|jgi:hypothetical protein|uniref:hypothetical protein n=1 Tax=Candidatus Izimoplasma sp. HR1 TaxID=1541959 RepID=UPI0004F61414|nr:hypothetical protein KQ51_01354 [Candidatus Izimaplasma bacterium HR1]